MNRRRKLGLATVFGGAFAAALITALAVHGAIEPPLLFLSGAVWMLLLLFSCFYYRWASAWLLLSLPMAFAAEVWLVMNLNECGKWLCL